MSILNNWYEDTIQEKDGRYKGSGFNAWWMKPFVDEQAIESRVQGARNRETAIGLGEDLSDLNVGPNASTLDVRGAAIRKNRERTSASEEKAHQRSMQLPLAQLKANTDATNAQLELTRETNETARLDSNNQFALQYERMLQQDKQANLARLDELAYRKAADMREDRRYNEALERQDRKDRQASIQTLVMGLANLGAAFAL